MSSDNEGVEPIRVIYTGTGTDEIFHDVNNVQVDEGALWLNGEDGNFQAVVAAGEWIQAVVDPNVKGERS